MARGTGLKGVLTPPAVPERVSSLDRRWIVLVAAAA